MKTFKKVKFSPEAALTQLVQLGCTISSNKSTLSKKNLKEMKVSIPLKKRGVKTITLGDISATESNGEWFGGRPGTEKCYGFSTPEIVSLLIRFAQYFDGIRYDLVPTSTQAEAASEVSSEQNISTTIEEE